MENISDYLYLVVVLVLGLFGALRKKRANSSGDINIPETTGSEAVDTSEYTQQEEGVEIDTDDQFWMETVVDEERIIEAVPSNFIGTDEDRYADALAADFMNEGVSAFTPENSPDKDFYKPDSDEISGESSEIVEEESIAAGIMRDFNLDEAIVYSEIINRKEHF